MDSFWRFVNGTKGFIHQHFQRKDGGGWHWKKLAIVLLLAWFASGLLINRHPSPKNPEEKPFSVVVFESIAQPKTTYLNVQGVAEAFQKATLKAEVAGRIVKITADKGQDLEAGGDILEIALESRLAKQSEAQALVNQRQLEYNNTLKLKASSYRSANDVAASKSQLEAAESALQAIKQEIQDTKVQAPFRGRLDNRLVDVGDYVKVGDPLANFLNLEDLRVVVYVSENYIQDLKLGSLAEVKPLNGEKLNGSVSFLSSAAEPTTRTYRVEIKVDNRERRLPDGLTVEVKIALSTAPIHLLSPAIISMNDEGIVGIKAIDAQNKVTFHPIHILNFDAEHVWLKDLPPKLKVIVVGQEYVSVGQKVAPVLKTLQEIQGRLKTSVAP